MSIEQIQNVVKIIFFSGVFIIGIVALLCFVYEKVAKYYRRFNFSLFCRSVRFFIQRWTRGFDDSCCWSLDWHLAQYILPRLKLFAKHHAGTPSCLYYDENGEKIENPHILGVYGHKENSMCVVSMVMDHYWDKWEKRTVLPQSDPWWNGYQQYTYPSISQEEIDEFHKLLDRARKYDKEHNQPDCELAEKKNKLMQLAKELGVDINFGD